MNLKRELWRLWLRLKFHTWQRHRFNRLVLEKVAGRPFLILPEVFNPTLFLTSEFMVSVIDENMIPVGATVLDMGTGSGLGAVFAARWAAHVVAIDINPAAVRSAHINAILNDVDDRVTVMLGDLFAPVAGKTFDRILFNPPFLYGEPSSMLDRAFHAQDVIERFAAQARSYLRPDGRVLLLLSSEMDEPAALALFAEQSFSARVAARRRMPAETITLYELFLDHTN